MEGLPPKNIATVQTAVSPDAAQNQPIQPNGGDQWVDVVLLFVLLGIATLLAGLLPATWEWLARVAIVLAILSAFRPLFVQWIMSLRHQGQPAPSGQPACKRRRHRWGVSETVAVFLVTLLTIANIVWLFLG